MTSKNTKTIEKLVGDVMGKGKVDQLDTLMAADFSDATAPPGFPPDRNGWKMLVQHVRQAFPDAAPEVQQTWEDGNEVIVRVQATGTMKGDGLGFKALGKKVTWNELHVWSFRGDKIVSHFGIGDLVMVMMMNGSLPAQMPAKR
jgi:predicted ester cyclase